MLRLSTGLRTLLMGGSGGGSLQQLMAGGVIRIFSGTQPGAADLVEPGVMLAEISLDSGTFVAGDGTSVNGITFDDAVTGVLSKAAAETWSGTATINGIAGWFRFYNDERVTGATSVGVHFDGSVATAGGQMVMTNTSVASGTPVVVQSLTVTMPAT